METSFTPLDSLGGGILIGVAATLLMALNGRILGATGILSAATFDILKGGAAERWALLLGMMTGPVVVMLLTGAMPVVTVPVSTMALLVGGVIVGVGVTFGAGCTSGHGVCGMARLSPRSIVATLTFMATTFVTVYAIRHVIGG